MVTNPTTLAPLSRGRGTGSEARRMFLWLGNVPQRGCRWVRTSCSLLPLTCSSADTRVGREGGKERGFGGRPQGEPWGAVGEVSPVVSPRPRVSRPQAGRWGGRSGGFGWWALRKLDHPGSAGAGLRGLPGFPAAGMSWAARALGASFSSWGGRIRELSRGRRVLGCGSRSVRGGAAPGCREIRCPLDNEPSGGVGATSFFGFVTHPYVPASYQDHGSSPDVRASGRAP